MKYLSIDIETTGLNPEKNEILSIGVIVEDTNNKLPFEEIPKFHVAIKREEITGSPFAINMNKDLIEAIVHYQEAESLDEKNDLVHMTGMQFLNESDVADALFRFLYDNGMVKKEDTSGWSHAQTGEHFRIINGKSYPVLKSNMNPVSLNVAGKNFGTFDKLFIEKLPRWKQIFRIKQRIIDPSILFTNWIEDDSLPSLNQCKRRANIEGVVTHNALEDAWDVVELLRTQY